MDESVVAPFLRTLPFVIGVAALAGFGFEDVGVVPADVAFVPALCLALAAFFLYSHLPTLPATARRMSVLPMVIVSSAMFNGHHVRDLSHSSISATLVHVGAGLFVFLILLSGFFYAVFVFSPAQIADAKGSWSDWAVRYALFLIGSLIGISLLGAIHR